VDHQPRPGVCENKRRRDRLIRWAAAHPDWVLGCADETWWSRLARPALSTWAEADRPLRLVEQTVATPDPDPRALACYGLVLAEADQVWLRVVDGRPVSAVTTPFLAWCCAKLAAQGKRALLRVWDNASWHISQAVEEWLRAHNRAVRQTGTGVRIIPCLLPTTSPWLNPIEPHWTHGKRAVAEPDRLLAAQELAERVCAYFDCPYEAHLAIPEEAAWPEAIRGDENEWHTAGVAGGVRVEEQRCVGARRIS
jgi:DDE superfamily endonuclease